MNIYIKDGLQTVAAVLITCSMVASAAPVPARAPTKVNEKPKIVVIEKKKSTKKVTWRDNPNKCDLKKQYIAKEKPFKCLKKIQAKSVQRVARSNRSVYVAGNWQAQCKKWAAQAGITLTSTHLQLIDRESDCNPTAQNPKSTAYGIGQFLNSTWGLDGVDCVKTSNPVRQLVCMDRYVKVVHKTWSNALSSSLRSNSY